MAATLQLSVATSPNRQRHLGMFRWPRTCVTLQWHCIVASGEEHWPRDEVVEQKNTTGFKFNRFSYRGIGQGGRLLPMAKPYVFLFYFFLSFFYLFFFFFLNYFVSVFVDLVIACLRHWGRDLPKTDKILSGCVGAEVRASSLENSSSSCTHS